MRNTSLRLFADALARSPERSSVQLVRSPNAKADHEPPVAPAKIVVKQSADPAGNVSTSVETVGLEQEIIRALDAQPAAGERVADAFRRKEHAVGGLFASLTLKEARLLHRRLTLGDARDPIWQRFARLVPDRRSRLIQFLADASRRAALARGR